MAELSYDVRYSEARNRLTTAFRFLLVIPHLIVMVVWGYLAEILAVIQWFIILFTGKRNASMFDLQNSWLNYSGRVSGYEYLLFDEFPAFGAEPDKEPVIYNLAYEEPANRLTNALRLIWAIPAMLLAMVYGIAMTFVAIAAWFAIVITGKLPRGMFDFILKVTRFSLQLNAYTLLMTDTYPRWGSGVPSATPTLPGGPSMAAGAFNGAAAGAAYGVTSGEPLAPPAAPGGTLPPPPAQ